MTGGQHGHPEREGYGTTHLAGGVEPQMDEAPGPPPEP